MRPRGIGAALKRWPVLLAMGGLDGLALSSVIVAGGLAQASYASVASSLFGVVTILLAWAVLGEKVKPVQGIGIALIFIGLGRLAIG
jgi:drug/metabolite transporter (DMT)-like permease